MFALVTKLEIIFILHHSFNAEKKKMFELKCIDTVSICNLWRHSAIRFNEDGCLPFFWVTSHKIYKVYLSTNFELTFKIYWISLACCEIKRIFFYCWTHRSVYVYVTASVHFQSIVVAFESDVYKTHETTFIATISKRQKLRMLFSFFFYLVSFDCAWHNLHVFMLRY